MELGGHIVYKANVKRILMEPGPDGRERAVGVQLADGRRFRCGQGFGLGSGVDECVDHGMGCQ